MCELILKVFQNTKSIVSFQYYVTVVLKFGCLKTYPEGLLKYSICPST